MKLVVSLAEEFSWGDLRGKLGGNFEQDFGEYLSSNGADDSELEVIASSRRQRYSPVADDQFDALDDVIPSAFPTENNNPAGDLSAENPQVISSDDETSSDKLPEVNELVQSQQPPSLFSEGQ